jgi:hypothetical protein
MHDDTTATIERVPSPAETLAFGIEIECYMPAGQVFEMGSYHRGRQIRGIDNWSARGWTAEKDASVTASRPGFVGVEIVSPKLYGEDGLSEVVCMIDWLQEIGAYVDYKCGQHVSVDAAHLTVNDVVRIKDRFTKWERGMFLVNGTNAAERWQSGYCVPFSSGRTAPAARYWALNITNMTQETARKRLEYRLWAGTLDAAKTVSYILASVGFQLAAGLDTLPATVPADGIDQVRGLTKAGILGYRVVPNDDEIDLTDICRDIVKTAREGVADLARVTGRP